MPHDLKIREPHSPQNLTLAKIRIPWYIDLGRNQCKHWLPLRYQPLVLLQPLLAVNDNAKDHDMTTKVWHWKRLKINYGYFDYVKNDPGKMAPSEWRVRAQIRNFMISRDQK